MDPVLAFKACQLSNSVYKNFSLECENVKARIFEEDGKQHIVFAGSDDAIDWVEDCNALPVTIPGLGICHLGFNTMFGKIHHAVDIIVAESKLPKYVYGHSAGGALAQRYAAALAMGGYKVKEVYTFGCPRLWSHEAGQKYDALGFSTYNFIHGFDEVPDQPILFTRRGLDFYLDIKGNLLNARMSSDGYTPLAHLYYKVHDHFLEGKRSYLTALQNFSLKGDKK